MGEFAKWAAKVTEEEPPRQPIPDWRERTSEQVNRFREVMPLSAEEGAANASKALSEIYKLLFGLGYNFRAQRHLEKPTEATHLLPEGDPGIPGRDISISMPKLASWMEPRLLSKEAVGPLRAALQNREVEYKAKAKEKMRRAFTASENPLTVPGFVPMAAIAAPEAFRKGFTQADADAAAARNEVLSIELEKAKQEFEEALNAEYRGHKSASLGELVDGLAEASLQLSKEAQDEQGSGMKALNVYLGLAALLGYGAHRAAEDYTKKRNPGYQKQKLYRLALRQRMHDKGVPVLVDFNELPAAKEELNLTDALPAPEMKEASAAAVARGGAFLPIIQDPAKPAPPPPKPKPIEPVHASVGRSFPTPKEVLQAKPHRNVRWSEAARRKLIAMVLGKRAIRAVK